MTAGDAPTADDDASKRAEAVMHVTKLAGHRYVDEGGMKEAIASEIREAVEVERGKGYGPGFASLARLAEPLAEHIVDAVRVNTPDQTGYGIGRLCTTVRFCTSIARPAQVFGFERT